jgi:hypothetical protein
MAQDDESIMLALSHVTTATGGARRGAHRLAPAAHAHLRRRPRRAQGAPVVATTGQQQNSCTIELISYGLRDPMCHSTNPCHNKGGLRALRDGLNRHLKSIPDWYIEKLSR